MRVYETTESYCRPQERLKEAGSRKEPQEISEGLKFPGLKFPPADRQEGGVFLRDCEGLKFPGESLRG